MYKLHNICEFISHSAVETKQFASEFSSDLKRGDIVALTGSLGSGKTAFVSGLAEGLGYTHEVSSPTFTFVNEYHIDTSHNVLYHFDMYRIKSFEDLDSIGFFDYTDGIIAIEWFENICNFGIDPNYIISIDNIGEYIRKITVKDFLCETVRN
jgi:tRNA threonylcarbamoyladenosine biosynthesis protein TsaE